MPLRLTAALDRFPLAGAFTIARGSRTEAVVLRVALSDGVHVGRGEGTPYARYGESPEASLAAVEALAPLAADERLDQARLLDLLPAGAARNAIDCALWDLAAKQAGRPVWALAGLPEPKPVTTCYTISLGTPEQMAAAAARSADRPILKVKLGAPGDAARLAAVRAAAPGATLVVDANEGWRAEDLPELFAACAAADVRLVEQPLPAGADAALAALPRPVPVCADESCHNADDVAALADRYDAVNLKLDKTGGLTEALRLAAEAERVGLDLMVGCMVATSLAMAPALLFASRAAVVDLDGPLLLARDRDPGLRYEGSTVFPPDPALWG